MPLRRTARFRRRLRSPVRLATALLLVGLAGAEALGRHANSDLADLAALAVVTMLATATARARLGWVAAARSGVERLVRAVRARWPRFGADLRDDRPFRRAAPAVAVGAIALLGVVLLAEIAWIAGAGVAFRPAAAQILYLGYLALTAVLWLGLLAGSALMIALPLICLHDLLQSHVRGPRRRRLNRAGLLAWFGGILIGSLVFPDWVPVALCGAAVVVAVGSCCVGSEPRLTLLWRRGADDEVCAVDWRAFFAATGLLFALPCAILVVGALGGPAIGLAPAPDAAGQPITHFLGRLGAWLGGPGVLLACVYQAWLLRRARRADPATPCPVTLHVGGEVQPDDHRRIRDLVRSRGWRVRASPLPPRPLDVRLRLVEPPMRRPRGRWTWPLEVSLPALSVPELLDRLARRDVAQRRRALLKGLESLFRRARRHAYGRGSGFWIAPHYWFVEGLTRDTEEEFDNEDTTIAGGVIGPPYARVLPLAARHHLWQVTRAVQVDIVFVEDGVTWKQVRRVFRCLFDHFDTYGAGRRIDDIHFSGLPRIRVVLHDLEPGAGFEHATYPEPDYDEIGRARVLHVFRDRGGDEDRIEAPDDTEGIDSPAEPILTA